MIILNLCPQVTFFSFSVLLSLFLLFIFSS